MKNPTNHGPPARRPARRPTTFRTAEPLEPRVLLADNTLFFFNARDMAYDDARGLLYFTLRHDRIVARYDPHNKVALPPVEVPATGLFGFDLTPDGRSLYVAASELADPPFSEDVRPVVRRVDLASGTVAPGAIRPDGAGSGFFHGSAFDLAVTNNSRALGVLGVGVPSPVLELDLGGSDWSPRPDFKPVYGNLPPHAEQDARLFRSADRSLVAIAGLGRTGLTLYDSSADVFTRVRHFGGSINAVALSPDGSQVAVGIVNGTSYQVELCDRALNTVRTFDNAGGFLAFNAGGDMLYTGTQRARPEYGDLLFPNVVGHDLRTGNETFPREIRGWAAPRIGYDLYNPPTEPFAHNDALVSGDGRWLFLSNGEMVEMVDLAEIAAAGRPVIEGLPPPLRGDTLPMLYAGVPTPITVRVLDYNGQTNAAYRGVVSLDYVSFRATEFVIQHRFTEQDAGVHTFSVTYVDYSILHSGSGVVRARDVGRSVWHDVTARLDLRGPDLSPPVPLLSAGSVPFASAPTHTFKVTYVEDRELDFTTLGDDDVVVVAPNGSHLPVRLVGHTSEGWTHTGEYEVAAPGGAWDPADAGTYTVRTNAGGVIDRAHNATAAADVGTFAVTAAVPFDLAAGFAAAALPATVIGGERGRAVVTVTNLGTLPARLGGSRLTLRLSADAVADGGDAVLAEKVLPNASVKGGAKRPYPLRFVVPETLAPGAYTLLAAVEPPAGTGDFDPRNNTAAGPAVAVAARTVSLSPVMPAPVQFRAGRAGRFSMHLHNAGSVAGSGAAGVRLLLSTDATLDASDVLLAEAATPITLAAGRKRRVPVSFQLPAPVAPGEYVVFAVVDPQGGWAADANRGDNTASVRARVS